MNIASAAALTTALVAIVVAIITLGQWVTNRARLRHELFDRRYAVYEKITEFIADILVSGKVPAGEPDGFSRRTKTAYFVFACDKDVKVLVKQIREKAVELHALEATLESLKGDERTQNVAKQMVVKNWLEQTLDSMESKFEKYFKLTH